MNRIIITAIGADRPGLVSKITSIISQNNGNIENSKMIKIENQFAIILDFSSPENIDNIKQKLNLINDLEIYYKYLKKTKIMVKPTSTYLIKGSDDQGIVERISNYFKIQNLNITEIDTFVEPAPVTGSPLFNIKVTVEHSSTTNSETVDKDLIQICKQLNLTLK